jgi:hypothetical protein
MLLGPVKLISEISRPPFCIVMEFGSHGRRGQKRLCEEMKGPIASLLLNEEQSVHTSGLSKRE